VKIKAEFPNARHQLWPGQFVNVRLKVQTLEKAIVVPTAAVQRGPAGTFVYVIGDGDVVAARPVTVTQQNEKDAVIASGITLGDRVVTTGFANLRTVRRSPSAPTIRRRRPTSRRASGRAGRKGGHRGAAARKRRDDGAGAATMSAQR